MQYNDTASPPNYVRSVLLDSSRTIKTQINVDGLNRPVKAITSAAPAMTPATITVDTSYDALGRIYQVSNPYYSTADSTYGVTSYFYDALGRTVEEMKNPDSTYRWWCYEGQATSSQPKCNAHLSSTVGDWVDVEDESGNVWQKTTDGLGRLIDLEEPSGGAAGTGAIPSLETRYSYDALGNLSVNQCGGPCPSNTSRSRSFTYDGLSRLIQAYNPESGWVCYGTTPSHAAPNGANCTSGYDGNGNLTAKTDARSVTISYSYDSLNRLTQKSYSDGTTPVVNYAYDGYDVTGALIAPPVSYAKGRLSQSAVAAANVLTTFSYDPMGRVLSKQECIPGDCSGKINVAATYDSAGDMLTLTNGWSPHPIAWTYQYDGFARLKSVISGVAVESISKLFDASSTSPPSYGPEGLEYASFGYNTATNLPLLTFQHHADSRLRPIFSGYFNSSGTALYTYCMPGTVNPNCTSTGSPYTQNGNVANVIDSVTGTWSFTYDTLNRLASGTASSGSYSGKIGCWTYDSFGNRTSESLSTTACNNNPPLTSWAAYNDTNTNRMDRTSLNSVQSNYYDGAGNETFEWRV